MRSGRRCTRREAVGVIDREHERQRRHRPDARHLPEPSCGRIVVPTQCFKAAIQATDLVGESVDEVEQLREAGEELDADAAPHSRREYVRATCRQAFAEGIGQTTCLIDQACPIPHEGIADAEERQVTLCLLGAMGHRSKKRWIDSPEPREGLCIVPIGLTIALADQLDTPSIRDDNFMAALPQQATEPRRVRASLEDDASRCVAPDTIGDRLPSRSDLELL
jgi:hypothetical protein